MINFVTNEGLIGIIEKWRDVTLTLKREEKSEETTPDKYIYSIRVEKGDEDYTFFFDKDTRIDVIRIFSRIALRNQGQDDKFGWYCAAVASQAIRRYFNKPLPEEYRKTG